MPSWKATRPKDDAGYFERMTTHIFSAGLNWQVVENKKPAFEKAFKAFEPAKVAKLTEKDVKRLMDDANIVRNEKKIRATIENASEFLEIKNEHESFRKYLDSFQKDEEKLQNDLQGRFHHLGPSSTRMFLWSVAYPLTPNAEEKKWMSSHKMGDDGDEET